MKNRKKLALLAFATSMAVLSWVYPLKQVKAEVGRRAHPIPCYHQDTCTPVSAGADCVPGSMGCIPNPCPSGTTPML